MITMHNTREDSCKDRRDADCNFVRLIGELVNFSPSIADVPEYGVLKLNVFKYKFSPIKIDVLYNNEEHKLNDDDPGKWFEVLARFEDVRGRAIPVAYSIIEVEKMYIKPTTEEYYTYYESKEELESD